MTHETASPVTVPLVPGVQARGNAISGNGCGATTLAVNLLVGPAAAERSPGLLAHIGDAPLVRRFVAQAAAARMLGEFVSRGPCTSVRYQAVSMTCER